MKERWVKGTIGPVFLFRYTFHISMLNLIYTIIMVKDYTGVENNRGKQENDKD